MDMLLAPQILLARYDYDDYDDDDDDDYDDDDYDDDDVEQRRMITEVRLSYVTSIGNGYVSDIPLNPSQRPATLSQQPASSNPLITPSQLCTCKPLRKGFKKASIPHLALPPLPPLPPLPLLPISTFLAFSAPLPCSATPLTPTALAFLRNLHHKTSYLLNKCLL